jgi:hypothetical protein
LVYGCQLVDEPNIIRFGNISTGRKKKLPAWVAGNCKTGLNNFLAEELFKAALF